MSGDVSRKVYNLNNKERMQKIYLVLLVGILGTFIGEQVQGMSAKIDNVLLENVEALAEGEASGPCKGFGSVYCTYNGFWVEYQYQN